MNLTYFVIDGCYCCTTAGTTANTTSISASEYLLALEEFWN